MTEEEKEIYNDVMNEMIAYENEIHEHNKKILEDIKSMTSEEYCEVVIDFLKESFCDDKYEFIDKSQIKHLDLQNEDWDLFDHYYVDQYVNGGFTGDTFAGYLYIPIKDDTYLKAHYSE